MKTIEPKQEFLRTTEAITFAEIMGGEPVRNGISVALAQFVQDQLRQDTFEQAAKQQYELQGAKKFIAIFLNLTEPEQSSSSDNSGKLLWHSKPPQPPAQQAKLKRQPKVQPPQ